MIQSDRITEISESDAQTSYPITSVLWSGSTKYCSSVIIAASKTYGNMLFLDGELQSASADEHIYHEALVHPVMSEVQQRSRVLIVGGGEGATLREVLKWNPLHVDWVDIDGELVEHCQQWLQWGPAVTDLPPHVRFYAEDIAHFWRHCETEFYDVIILDLPDPDGETGYLYSSQFWDDVRCHLTPNGAFVTHVGPVRPYGDVGMGVIRTIQTTYEAGIELRADGFYHTCIPSFQGEWGYWKWFNGNRRLTNAICPVLPAGLRVVDAEQLLIWSIQTRVWKREIEKTLIVSKKCVPESLKQKEIEGG